MTTTQFTKFEFGDLVKERSQKDKYIIVGKSVYYDKLSYYLVKIDDSTGFYYKDPKTTYSKESIQDELNFSFYSEIEFIGNISDFYGKDIFYIRDICLEKYINV